MMKSWADHCSSDEESIDDDYQKEEEDIVEEPAQEDAAPPVEPASEARPPPQEVAPASNERVYVFPDKAPFTAHVGNLPWTLKEPENLKAAVADLAEAQLDVPIQILGGRIAFDRSGQHRGFGYVEVETLDQLKALMKLNEGDPKIDGRRALFNTNLGGNKHNNHGRDRRGHKNNFGRDNDRNSFGRRDHGEADGSNFRGGRFNNRHGSDANANDRAPAQRTSLKLAPRTKPRENAQVGSSSIFGGAKARDEKTWEEKRKHSKREPDDKKKDAGKGDHHGDRRKPQGARGHGAGRGGGRTGAGRGRGDANNKRDSTNRRSQTQPEKAPVEAGPSSPTPAAAPPTVEKVTNKFAALMDSDSE